MAVLALVSGPPLIERFRRPKRKCPEGGPIRVMSAVSSPHRFFTQTQRITFGDSPTKWTTVS